MCGSLRAALAAVIVTPLLSAQALSAGAVFNGTLTVSNVTNACNKLPGLKNGVKLPAVFRIPLSPVDPPTALLVTFKDGAFIGFPQNPLLTGPYNGVVITPFATAANYNGGTYNVTLTPKPITPATKKITITGQITKFAGIAGCTVTSKTIVNVP